LANALYESAESHWACSVLRWWEYHVLELARHGVGFELAVLVGGNGRWVIAAMERIPGSNDCFPAAYAAWQLDNLVRRRCKHIWSCTNALHHSNFSLHHMDQAFGCILVSCRFQDAIRHPECIANKPWIPFAAQAFCMFFGSRGDLRTQSEAKATSWSAA